MARLANGFGFFFFSFPFNGIALLPLLQLVQVVECILFWIFVTCCWVFRFSYLYKYHLVFYTLTCICTKSKTGNWENRSAFFLTWLFLLGFIYLIYSVVIFGVTIFYFILIFISQSVSTFIVAINTHNHF